MLEVPCHSTGSCREPSTGVFLGVSGKIGSVVPSLIVGAHRNRIKVTSTYWENTPSHTDLESTYYLDSTRGAFTDYSTSAKLGFLLDRGGNTLPYVTFAVSRQAMWPGGFFGQDRFLVDVTEVGMGVKRRLKKDLHLYIESNYAALEMESSYKSYHFNMKSFLSLGL